MNILLLDPQKSYAEKLRDIRLFIKEATIIPIEELGDYMSDTFGIDVIVAVGNFSTRSRLIDPLVNWRTHPHNYLVPCWIGTDSGWFQNACFWPQLSIDRYDMQLEVQSLGHWLTAVTEWQQNRLLLPKSDSFENHCTLEIATSLSLRKATGTLSIFDNEGSEGNLVLRDGHLVDGTVKHFRDEDAFHEFLCWSKGSYYWNPEEPPKTEKLSQPLHLLIGEGLRLFREANLLYHFLPSPGHPIARTSSESALDDSAVPYFEGLKAIYNLIDGRIPADELIQASLLSKPRTMSCMAKWFSLGDIALAPSSDHGAPSATDAAADSIRFAVESSGRPVNTPAATPENGAGTRELLAVFPEDEDAVPTGPSMPARRLLIVDDSQLMCKALRTIFSKDSRFEIVGTAHDGIEALELIDELKPDVVTLDMQMPRMDGLTALKHIMIRDPKPVVILSAFTKETSQLTYESFKYGAVDVFSKPSKGNLEEMEKEAERLRDGVAQASFVRMEAAQYIRRRKNHKSDKASADAKETSRDSCESDLCMVIIVCGAGGFPSLLKSLFSVSSMKELPPIVTSMAMPERVVEALVPNLQKDCGIRIDQLPYDSPLEPGTCYLLSFDHECRFLSDNGRIKVRRTPTVHGQNRVFDRLLAEVAESFGDRTAVFLISGSGDDGLEGVRRVREKGGRTFALSPEVCLKPELPRRALEEGSAEEIKSAVELARMIEGRWEAFSGKPAGTG